MSATYIHTKRKPGFSQIVLRLLAVFYVLALAATIVYLWFFTQDRFFSTAEFRISRQNNSGLDGGLLQQLALPGLSDSGSADSQTTIGYINSADLLLELEKEFNLVEHYTFPPKDFVFRLAPGSHLEQRLAFYRARIRARFNKESGMTEITVDSFAPELSQRVAASLLKKAESFVNRVNQDIAEQQLASVIRDVERTAKDVEEVEQELLTLQNENNFISPDEVISASLKAVEEMKMEHLKAKAELSSMLRDSPNSPRIESLRSHLCSLNELIDIETKKLSGPEKDRLNQLLIQFKQLELKLENRTRRSTGAEMLLLKNRSDAVTLTRFFTVIQRPFLPENAALPRKPYATVTILSLGFLLFLILRALTRSVLDRAT